MKINNLNRKGFDNLYADGKLYPGDYLKNGDVYSEDGTKILGVTKYRGKKYIFWGKQQIDVYLYPKSFRSPERLYLTIGHELIHVFLHNKYNLFNNGHQEATAYSWSYEQAKLWGLNTLATSYKWSIYNIGNGKPFSYPKPTRTARPIWP